MLISHKTDDMVSSREQPEKQREKKERERKKRKKPPRTGIINVSDKQYHDIIPSKFPYPRIKKYRYNESNKAGETKHILIFTTAIGNSTENRHLKINCSSKMTPCLFPY